MVENGKMLEINHERIKMVKILRKIEIDDERQTLCFQFGKGNETGASSKKTKMYENVKIVAYDGRKTLER